MQVKLLRVLQERELERLGGRETIRVDVRVVAATHRDLEGLVESGSFREDLFYRLNVVPLQLPPLRDRTGDIELLARHFCDVHSRANGHSGMTLDDEVLAILTEQPWPGNVRQLENFLERLVVLSDGPGISADDVRRELGREQANALRGGARTPTPIPVARESLSLEERQRKTERETLNEALARSGNNRTLAARLLGVSRRTLYTKLETHGLL